MDAVVEGREPLDLPRPSTPARAYGTLIIALEIWCAFLMLAMTVIVLLGVWYRYVVQRALPWYDEFAEFLLVWLTFYGAVLAAHRGGHISFETLLDYVPRGVRRVLLGLADLVVLGIQLSLVVYGWKLAQAASFDTAISVRAVRLSWIYSAIPISGALIFLIGLPRLVRRAAGRDGR